MRISEAFAAGVPKSFKMPGNLFSLDSVPGGTVSVSFWKNGQKLPEDMAQAIAGMGAIPENGFDEVELTSSLTQTVAFYISRGRVFSNVFSGAVTVLNATASGAFVHTAKQVTNASQSLAAANAARKYLRIENQDAALTLFLKCDGTAATASNASHRLLPGEVFEPLVAPTGEVRGIMSAATGANNVNVTEA
jgi:hypothetical protein